MKITTKDGREFEYVCELWNGRALQWRGMCTTCGEPFYVTTPKRFKGTHAFDQKRCPTHKLSRGQAINALVRARRNMR